MSSANEAGSIDLVAVWEEHLKCEFVTKSARETILTMIPEANVNHVPVMTGGNGIEELERFYATSFIPQMPPDTAMVPISRTVGMDRLVDEFIFKFTHTIRMDWMLPGIPPTSKPVELPIVVIAEFKGGNIASEHIYWDQATVLVQLGLLDPKGLPVAGIAQARKAVDPSRPSNELMTRPRLA